MSIFEKLIGRPVQLLTADPRVNPFGILQQSPLGREPSEWIALHPFPENSETAKMGWPSVANVLHLRHTQIIGIFELQNAVNEAEYITNTNKKNS